MTWSVLLRKLTFKNLRNGGKKIGVIAVLGLYIKIEKIMESQVVWFITYVDILDKVRRVVEDNGFIVSETRNFRNLCQVWAVDDGDPDTVLTRALQLGQDIKALEYNRH